MSESTSTAIDEILIVDDTTANLELLTDILTRAGYKIRPASSGELALRSVKAKIPALILLDIKMPGMDGLEVCRQLKAAEKTRTIPVIFISVLEDERSKIKGFQAGAVDYLTKPFYPEEILVRVKTHLSINRLQLKLERQNEQLLKEIAEREQAEEALQETNARHSAMVANIGDVIGIMGADGIMKYKSPNIERWFGWKPEDLVGADGWETVHPEDIERVQKEFYTLIEKDNASTTVEYRYKCKDGTYTWIELVAVNCINDTTINGILLNYHDISDRKQVEKNLRKSEEKFRATFFTNPDAINLNRAEDGVYIDINEGFTKIMGYSREDILGKYSGKLNIWNNPKDREKLVSGLKENGLVENLEADFIGKDGQIRTGLMSARLLRIENQDVILSITRNITEKKQTERSLIESEEKYKTLFERESDAIFIYDPDTTYILDANKATSKMYGYTNDELIGMSCLKFSGEVEKSASIIEKTRERDNINVPIRFHCKKDETIFPIEINNYAITLKGKRLMYAVCKDISKQKQAEDERKKLESQLQQSQRMESIGTLAGGIAHDFNNILFPIVGHTEMLMEDIPEDSPFQDSLKAIHTSALRAKSLVKQILTFSRQDANELQLMKMQPIIMEALKLIRSTIPTTIEIKQDIQTDCGIIKAEPTQIHQIVMNLATNAYHAMEEIGGELKVGLKQIELGTLDLINPDMTPGQYACLTVADTGMGMDKKLTQKIFDPFFTTKAIGKGTGMGLSVVHGIVAGMGGAVWVYSEPGKGTQFYVYFPVEKSSFEKQNVQTHETIQYGTETILLVDDEDAIITMEKRMLERLGYQVTSRISSIEALEAFRANPDKFDLVITDMAMPNMAGDKLSTELTKIRSDIPVLLCTGFSETMSEEKAVSLGIKGFIFKPIVMKDLAQKIREVLDENSGSL